MHSCPNCGQGCYCNGDLGDTEVDDSAADRCDHCADADDDVFELTDDEIEAYIDDSEQTPKTPEEQASLRRIDSIVREILGMETMPHQPSRAAAGPLG